MKKILILISAALLTVAVNAQFTRGTGMFLKTGSSFMAAPAKGLFTVTDDFESYATGGLSGRGNWLNCRGNFNVADVSGNNVVAPNYNLNDACIMRTETFSSDQYAEIELIGEPIKSGVAVRCQDPGNSTAEYYTFFAYSSTRRVLARVVNGTFTTLIDKPGATEAGIGSVIKLEVKGDTLKCYINGSLDTSLNTTGIYVDNTIGSGGTPGIVGYGNGGASTMDNFKGGDL